MMIVEVRFRVNNNVSVNVNIVHLTLAATVDWYDPQEAAVSRAQVDPILPTGHGYKLR